MRKKILFFAYLIYISFVSSNLYSQENTCETKKTRHELNIIVDDIFAKSPVTYPSYYEKLYINDYTSVAQNTPKIGLGYKFGFNNSALRTKISFASSQNSSNNSSNDSENNYSALSTQFNVGYELQKNINKLQVFYGLDVFAVYTTLTTKYSNVSNSTLNESKNSSTTIGYGGSPFFGIKYFVLPNLSISTEITFSVESYQSTTKSSYTGNPETSTDTKGTNTHFGSLGNIGINLHF